MVVGVVLAVILAWFFGFFGESMQNRGGDYAAADSAAPSFAGRKPG